MANSEKPIDIRNAMLNPAFVFLGPEDVLQRDELTREQKDRSLASLEIRRATTSSCGRREHGKRATVGYSRSGVASTPCAECESSRRFNGSLNYWTRPDPWGRCVSRLLNEKTATSERWGWASWLRRGRRPTRLFERHRNIPSLRAC